jgi:hypothetical protein
MSHVPARPVQTIACAAVCALLCCLVLAGSASAATTRGGWPAQSKDIQHLHFETGVLDVKPGQNGIDNIILGAESKPKVDGYMIRMRPDLHLLDGTVPPVDVLHLHHGVWFNISRSAPGAPLPGIEPIFFGGEEKSVFQLPKGYGYPYKATDKWLLNHMIHNNTSQATKVRLVWDIDFVPATSALAKKIKPVEPIWMDVRAGQGYPVFDVGQNTGGADKRFTFPDEGGNPYAGGRLQNQYQLPTSGTLVAAVGHLHPGGLYDDIDLMRSGGTPPAKACGATGKCARATAGHVPGSVRIFRSQAHYYDPAGPVSWDVSLTASKPAWRVKVRKGDTLRISSTYDSAQSSWYENMGIVLVFMAADGKGIDPFKSPVDWRGALTHGHLPENDNHGGLNAGLPDPAKAAAGPVTQQVEIKDFRFLPGDLGSLASGGKVPTVPQGQSLSFLNEDDPNVEWHSITACRAPCNRSTGISYPLANGQTQFDSGQLGFGPAGLSPAANRLDWSTPDNLGPGTYTYFCRVHAFMRGAFRVQ